MKLRFFSWFFAPMPSSTKIRTVFHAGIKLQTMSYSIMTTVHWILSLLIDELYDRKNNCFIKDKRHKKDCFQNPIFAFKLAPTLNL